MVDPCPAAGSLALFDPAAQQPTGRLQNLLAQAQLDEAADVYGQGGAVARLESRVAALLGKPAAVLMPTGAMACQVALRVHADARATRLVGFHPQAHIEVHEEQGYRLVHQLVGRHLGAADRLFTLADLHAVTEPLAAVMWELPQRDLGGLLPSWDDLVGQTGWAAAHGAATHLDGARLWEAQPFYDRPHAEIAALFDTAYVSLYKGLGGMAGGLLVGPEPLIEQARQWRTRLGGRLYQSWPIALAGHRGLDSQLPQMAAFAERARQIAAALAGADGVQVVPAVPQTPLFHLRFAATKAALDAAHAELLAEGGMRIFLSCQVSAAGGSQVEVSIGAAALTLAVAQVRDAVVALARRAQRHR